MLYNIRRIEIMKLVYTKKLKKYIDKLSNSTKKEDKSTVAEIFRILDLLENKVNQLGLPYSRMLKGYKYKNIQLRELRVDVHVPIRIFYFIKNNKIIVLFDYKIKKSRKLGNTVLKSIFQEMKTLIDEMEE
jgi:hypothetical protein